MFAETLLESSSGRKRKRWPMATAFTVQTIIAAIVIIVPLLSTGVIPLSARMQIVAPLKQTPLEPEKPVHTSTTSHPGPASAARETAVVLVSDNPNRINWGEAKDQTTNEAEVKPGFPGFSRKDGIPNLGGGDGSNVTLVPTRVPVSTLSQAQIINRVEPVYPKAAILANVQGEVKLHAIIARDGRIISLNVTSGHPLLVRAAVDAVSQWRYRPYYLNGQPVEVETFITVNFHREGR